MNQGCHAAESCSHEDPGERPGARPGLGQFLVFPALQRVADHAGGLAQQTGPQGTMHSNSDINSPTPAHALDSDDPNSVG